MKYKIAKTIRVITVAPFMALVLLLIMYRTIPTAFFGITTLLLPILFLVLLPVSAYIVQPMIPYLRRRGRSSQRTLAIIMANVGYVLGIITTLSVHFSREMLIIYFTYLFSGLFIALFNYVIKISASGHACGVAGPIAALTYFLGWPALFGLVLLAATYWASRSMKRHTLPQLLAGTLIPLVALALSILSANLIMSIT